MAQPIENEDLFFSYVVNLIAFDGNRWDNENYSNIISSFQGQTFNEIEQSRSQVLEFANELDNVILSEKYEELKRYGLSEEKIALIEKYTDKAVEIFFLTDEVVDEKIYAASLIEMLDGLNIESQQYKKLGKKGIDKQRVSLEHGGEKYDILFSDFLQVKKKLIINGLKEY